MPERTTRLCDRGPQPHVAAPPELRTYSQTRCCCGKCQAPSALRVLGPQSRRSRRPRLTRPGPLSSTEQRGIPGAGGFPRRPELRPHRQGHQQDVASPAVFFPHA